MTTEKKLTLCVGWYGTKKATFSSAEKLLRVLRDAGKKVKPEKGQLETEHSNSKREANYKQMKNIRERIKAALNIWRDAEKSRSETRGKK